MSVRFILENVSNWVILRDVDATDFESLDFATVVADGLENLLDLLEKAVVKDWSRQLDDAEVAGTFNLVFFAGRAPEVSIDGTEMRIVWTSLTRSEAGLIPAFVLDYSTRDNVFSSYVHRLWIFDVGDREALRLLGGEEAKLDFLDSAHGSARVGEMHVRHDCGLSGRR